jgi:hypothetical protein
MNSGKEVASLVLVFLLVGACAGHCEGVQCGVDKGYAEHACKEAGLEYSSHTKKDGHLYATCADRANEPVLKKVW